MAKPRTNHNERVDEALEKAPPRVRMRVKEADLPVRVRTGPGTDYQWVSGEYLGEGVHEIVELSEGAGSKSGWGKLSDGRGWVALDFTYRVRRNPSK